MSFTGRLIHTLALERATEGALDDYGQPERTYAEAALVAGLVQPKSVREVALLSQAGAVVGDYTIFMAPREITEADRIRMEPYDGRSWEITGIRSYEFGIAPHLEIDARLVGTSGTGTGSGSG